jgi:exodeoxyribonuclease VII large subunit
LNDLFSTPPPADTPAPRRVLTVEELNEGIRAALQDAFPGAVWVRGEVQRLPADAARRRHVYFELHGGRGGAAVSIPVALLEWDRQKYGLQRWLDGTDPTLRLDNNLEVCLQCLVDFYPPFGKLQLKMVGVDAAFTLGQLEAQRRQTLAWLEQEGLTRRNASLPFPALPLVVGLVTSAGSAAEKDFLTGLAASGRPFRVQRADSRMMGEGMVRQVVSAVRGLDRWGVDVIVVTRGGGSKADLSWFDNREVVEAIARSSTPVLTAIGHEIDTSIADLVAHHHCKTPTAAAQDLVDRVETTAASLEEAAAALADRGERRLVAARRELGHAATRLQAAVATRVGREGRGLERDRERALAGARLTLVRQQAASRRRAERLADAVVRRTAAAGTDLARTTSRLEPARVLAAWPRRARDLDRAAERLGRGADAVLRDGVRRLDHLGEKASLLDPRRLLARGYSLTLGPDGRLVREPTALRPGDRLTTRLRGGSIESIVEGTEAE